MISAVITGMPPHHNQCHIAVVIILLIITILITPTVSIATTPETVVAVFVDAVAYLLSKSSSPSLSSSSN